MANKKLWIIFLARNSDFFLIIEKIIQKKLRFSTISERFMIQPLLPSIVQFFKLKKASIFDFLPPTGKSPYNSPLKTQFTHPSASYASFISLNGKSKRSHPLKIFLGTVDFLRSTLSILAHSAADLAVIFASLHLKKGWQE